MVSVVLTKIFQRCKDSHLLFVPVLSQQSSVHILGAQELLVPQFQGDNGVGGDHEHHGHPVHDHHLQTVVHPPPRVLQLAGVQLLVELSSESPGPALLAPALLVIQPAQLHHLPHFKVGQGHHHRHGPRHQHGHTVEPVPGGLPGPQREHDGEEAVAGDGGEEQRASCH